MTTHITGSIPLGDIATATKRSAAAIKEEADELGLFIGTDWRGRPALSEVDARGLVDGSVRQLHEGQAAWAGHLAAAKAWEAEREHLVAEAASKAYEEATRRGEPNPKAAEEGTAAAVEVGRSFETSNPPPLFNGKVGAVQRRFADSPSLVRRVADRVLATVAP